jgi:hypothetical protein
VIVMHRQTASFVALSLCLPLLALSACDEGRGRETDIYGQGQDDGEDEGTPDEELPEPPEELLEMFQLAGAEFDVPATILSAIANVETQWQMVRGSTEFDGQEVATGLMALRGANLSEGAALAGVSLSSASTDPIDNIRAAAALLSVMADEHGLSNRGDIGSWAPVLAEYSGIDSQEGQDAYVFDEVMPMAVGSVGIEIGDAPIEVDSGNGAATPAVEAGPDYAGSIWRPSPNHSARPGGAVGDPSMPTRASARTTSSTTPAPRSRSSFARIARLGTSRPRTTATSTRTSTAARTARVATISRSASSMPATRIRPTGTAA